MSISTDKMTKRYVLAAALVTLAISGGYYARRYWTPRPMSVIGTVISIDPATRAGVLRIVHPRTGEPLDIHGQISPQCEILVNGAHATVSDVALDVPAAVEGMMYRSGTMVATRLIQPVPRVAPKQLAHQAP